VIDRRTFLCGLTLGTLSAPLVTRAQPAAKVYRIGWLSDGVRLEHGLQEEVTRGLAELGYTEGKNVLIERRNAEGKFERLPKLARELVALKVDLIVTFGGVPATRAAKAATASIPIVMAEAGDPVGTGLVASLARPGGNVTGLSTMAPDITRKKLQLLREVAPKISRVATLDHRSFEATVLNVREAEAAALALGLTVLPIEMGAFQTTFGRRPRSAFLKRGPGCRRSSASEPRHGASRVRRRLTSAAAGRPARMAAAHAVVWGRAARIPRKIKALPLLLAERATDRAMERERKVQRYGRATERAQRSSPDKMVMGRWPTLHDENRTRARRRDFLSKPPGRSGRVVVAASSRGACPRA